MGEKIFFEIGLLWKDGCLINPVGVCRKSELISTVEKFADGYYIIRGVHLLKRL